MMSSLNLFAIASEGEHIAYHSYRTFGVNLHSNGWGLNYVKGFSAKKNLSNLISLDYMTQNYPNERKTNRETQRNSPFVINKINNLYYFKAGFGKAIELSSRSDKSSLGVNGLFNIGPMMAVYKPIFIIYSNNDSNSFGTSVERYDPAIHQSTKIDSRARFWDGSNTSKVNFGLHAKTSLRFDWGSYESNFKSIETGINFQYITNAQPLIYSYAPKQFYTSFFVMLSFGRITD